MITSSTSSGLTPARLTLSRTTIAPRSVAEKLFNEPRNFPTGVREALIITASFNSDITVHHFPITIYYSWPAKCQAYRGCPKSGSLSEPSVLSGDKIAPKHLPHDAAQFLIRIAN